MLAMTHPPASGPEPRLPSVEHHHKAVWRTLQAKTKYPMWKVINGTYSEYGRKCSKIEKWGSIYWNDIFPK